MGNAAFRAFPRPHIERHGFGHKPATGTAFAGGEETVDFDIRSSSPVCLVCKLAGKFSPTGIGNVLGEFGIFDHVLHGEVFNTDYLVLVNQSVGQLVQVIHPAIGNFRVNAGNLTLGFQSILAAEFFLGKTTLILRQFSGVFRGVAGITGFKTIGRDEQILDAHVNAHLFIGNGQQRRLKFTQTGYEVATCVIFGNGDSGWVRWKLSTPLDIQWFIALRQLQLTVFKGKSAVSELRRLAVFFGFEGRVFRSTCKKVFERSLLIPQTLLQRNAGNIVQESEFRQLFNGSKSGIRCGVTDFFLSLIISIGAVTQDAVVNETHTAERPSQQVFLLLVRVKSKLVGAFDFHGSQCRQKSCEFLLNKVANDEQRRE